MITGRKFVKFACLLFVLVLLATCGYLYYLYRHVTHIPREYQKLLENQTTEQIDLSSFELEHEAKRIYDSAKMLEPWETTITQAMINGWLAKGLKERYGEKFPPEISNPRLLLLENKLKCFIHLKVQSSNTPYILTILITPQFTPNKQNHIRFVAEEIKLGSFPLTFDQVQAYLPSSFVTHSEIDFDLHQKNGKLVCDFKIPPILKSAGGKLEIKQIQFKQEKIYLRGTSSFLKKQSL